MSGRTGMRVTACPGEHSTSSIPRPAEAASAAIISATAAGRACDTVLPWQGFGGDCSLDSLSGRRGLPGCHRDLGVAQVLERADLPCVAKRREEEGVKREP